MRYIEPHGHMVSRTTDDYQSMVTAGCQAVCEPAFWAGFDRSSVDGFRDYFRQLTEYEPARAAKFLLPHFSWLCINPKESEDLALAADVLAMIPEFLAKPNVLGIGEIGLNRNTRNELKVLEQHVDLAVKHDQLILVHTPHLEDKLKGTRLIVDLLLSHKGVKPGRVIIDHVEEHTVNYILAAARRRYVGDRRSRPHLAQLRLRLGRERSARCAEDGLRNAPPRPQRRICRPSALPKPSPVPLAVPEVQDRAIVNLDDFPGRGGSPSRPRGPLGERSLPPSAA
jgi:predicted metal-dependent TIM-barrel fold hydrolase